MIGVRLKGVFLSSVNFWSVGTFICKMCGRCKGLGFELVLHSTAQSTHPSLNQTIITKTQRLKEYL